MSSSRKVANYALLSNRIRQELKKAAETLSKRGYESQLVSPKEFFDYMTGETPTGDKITIHDVLSSEYLVLHETVEISELKKMGVLINKQTVMNWLPKVCDAHYLATEHEFKYALDRKDFNWLKLRLTHAKDWLNDPYLPKKLQRRCRSIIEEFSEHLVASIRDDKNVAEDV